MKRVIIYGTGREFKRLFSGDDMYEWMGKNDISIVGVTNNNPDKFGKQVYISDSAYEITYAGDLKEDSYDYILVTTTRYFEEIKEFLMGLGIPEDKIMTVKGFIDQIINDTSGCKYGISVAAIVKDEADYIEEWLQFHILMGIEHFYIYDNESSDGTAEILKAYEKTGMVTYIYWPGKGQQVPVYANAIDRFKNESIYMAIIDVDEFLFSVAGKKIIDEVNQIWNKYKKAKDPWEKEPAAIGVNWATYGTSFYTNQSDDLVIRRFVYRLITDSHIKSIYNPRAVIRPGPHNAKFVLGYCCISENGSEISGPFFRDGKYQRLRVNHYVSKSEEEFIKRKKKGPVDSGIIPSEEGIGGALISHQTEDNEHYDPILVKYSGVVESAIKRFREEHMM